MAKLVIFIALCKHFTINLISINKAARPVLRSCGYVLIYIHHKRINNLFVISFLKYFVKGE